MKSIGKLQPEVNEWANKNFGTGHPAWHPLMGMIEELGELGHCHLKAVQGIRGTQAQHAAGIVDAVGDIVVYMCQYVSLQGITLQSVLSGWDYFYEFQNWVASAHPRDEPFMYDWRAYLDMSASLGAIAKMHVEHPSSNDKQIVRDLLRAFMIDIAMYCNIRCISLQEAIDTTWEMVSKRDWTKNKKDGVSE